MTRKPSFDELIGAETTGSERERLRNAHELLLQAGPPAELPPELRKAPQMGAVNLQERRRVMKRRTLILLAAAVSVVAVFFAGYAVSRQQNNKDASGGGKVISLKGTTLEPRARATLQVWRSRDGNLPMRLQVTGLRRLPPHSYYDVYLVRNGQLESWGLCGSFVVRGSSRVLTLKFNAPYGHEKGDSWVVTRPGQGGTEPGQTVLRPVTT